MPSEQSLDDIKIHFLSQSLSVLVQRRESNILGGVFEA